MMRPSCKTLTPRNLLNRSDRQLGLQWVLCVLLLALSLSSPSLLAKPRIAAASSLQFALNELLAEFDSNEQQFATPVYGASGNLFRQIMQGAPYQLFLSADPKLVAKLVHAGRATSEPVSFGEGRLALYKTASGSVPIDEKAVGVSTAIEREQVFRFAIANPRHAPYGVAALEALQALQIDQALQSRLVYGEKVSQAAMMVRSGVAQVGIVSLSLALSPALADVGEHVVLPADLHQPVLLQAMAVGEADQAVGDFLLFLQGARAREILTAYGMAR